MSEEQNDIDNTTQLLSKCNLEEKNKFTKDFLSTKNISELKIIVKEKNIKTTAKSKNGLINAILKNKKNNTKSSYTSLFHNGFNIKQAEQIGNLITFFQSQSIKQGTLLEKHINDFLKKEKLNLFTQKPNWFKKQNSLLDIFKHEKILYKLFIPIKYFKKSNIKCGNKTGIEIDFAVIDNNKEVTLVELKKGKDFDTKKSSGEVDSLMKIKKILEFNNIKVKKLLIVSYNAKTNEEFNIKTDLMDCETCSLINSKIFSKQPDFSKKLCKYVDNKFQEEADKNLKEFFIRIQQINNSL